MAAAPQQHVGPCLLYDRGFTAFTTTGALLLLLPVAASASATRSAFDAPLLANSSLAFPPTEATMAVVAALMQKTREYVKIKKFRDYVTSTHFWGSAANWGLSIAAFNYVKDPPDIISGLMIMALIFYSVAFMCFAYRVQPRNYLLLACHFSSVITQSIQACRYLQYYYVGGAEASNPPAK